MTPTYPVDIRVTNSNPVSAFAYFELVSALKAGADDNNPDVQTYFMLRTPGQVEALAAAIEGLPLVYRLLAEYSADHPTRPGELHSIRDFANLDDAKEFLVALNGPIEEDEDDE